MLAAPPGIRAEAQGIGPPNVLIILTDDQRATDTLQVMPDTLKWFVQGGASFPDAYAATPLCCPARAAIMTGQYAHNNGVRTNADKDNLVQASTIQKYLRDAGYWTGLVGKYLNGWNVGQDPPHFDRWAIMNPGYYNQQWNVNGTVHAEPTYTTDYATTKAEDFLQAFETNDAKPWFLYVAPYAPHAPLVPEADYANADVGTWPGNPGVFEADESDKPPYVQAGTDSLADAQTQRQGQLRMLYSVDDLVEEVFAKIQAAGELDNTLAFFLSDNGFMWSEHGLNAKNKPYTESIRIPFLMRWPGHVGAGIVDPRLVANIDVAPTIMDAAGIAAKPQYPADGTSLLDPASRTKLLTEAWAGENVGTWASIRTPRYQYVEYYASDETTVTFRELYVLAGDPWQIQNVLWDGDVSNDSDLAGLAGELAGARACAGVAAPTSCASVLTSPVALCQGFETTLMDHRVGTTGPDALAGTDGPDLFCGGDGKDTLGGGRGADQILGQEGADTLRGSSGRDQVKGGPGRDLLKGGRGRDHLKAGPDKDTCRGGPGRDAFGSCEVRTR